jgi:hypothetical protein
MCVYTTLKTCYTNLNRLVASGFPTRRFLFPQTELCASASIQNRSIAKRNFVCTHQYKKHKRNFVHLYQYKNPNGTLCARADTSMYVWGGAPGGGGQAGKGSLTLNQWSRHTSRGNR